MQYLNYICLNDEKKNDHTWSWFPLPQSRRSIIVTAVTYLEENTLKYCFEYEILFLGRKAQFALVFQPCLGEYECRSFESEQN